MNTISTQKKLISIVALLLALVMCFSACGAEPDSSNVESSAETSINQEASSEKSTLDEASSVQSETSSKVDKESSNVNSSASNTEQKESSNKTPIESQTSKTTWDDNYLQQMPKSVKDKGVSILLWRELLPTEQKVVDDFVKKTGCKVEKIITTREEYATKLVSLVTGKQAPDVVKLESTDFPGIVTKTMVPLDDKVFRLDDSCWNKSYMDAYRVNDNCYGVAMSGSWSCEDCLYVTFYLPEVLKSCGISESQMPYQLYKQGKWNWETQRNIFSKVAKANRGYSALSMDTWDVFMLSAGADFATYDGSKFINKLAGTSPNSMLTKSWQEICRLNENKYVKKWDLASVKSGKIAMMTTIAFAMQKESDYKFQETPGADKVMAVPVAGPTQSSAYVPYRPKTWGVAKGADNAEGAAYFLRYWLDINNCDMSSTFVNKQFEEVYNIISKPSAKKNIKMGIGVTNYVSSGTYEQICASLFNTSSANVTTIINSMAGRVNVGVEKANRDLSRIK